MAIQIGNRPIRSQEIIIWRTKSEIDQSEARKLLFTDANIFYMNTKFRQVIQFNLELQGVNMSNVIPKILNFNLIDNLTSNPKQTKKQKRRILLESKFKKFLRFFRLDAGKKDIITNPVKFSPPGAVVNGQIWVMVDGQMVKLVMVEKIYCNNDLFYVYKCQ